MEQELAQKLVTSLREAGIDVITYLPETRLSQILPLIRSDDSFKLIPVSSEAEAITIGAGAALGGKQVAVYMECTGLYVSCYSILSIAKRFGVPLLLLIAHLGSFADQRNNSV
jgi:sulfopyruvate decarboxylase subunit alpha